MLVTKTNQVKPQKSERTFHFNSEIELAGECQSNFVASIICPTKSFKGSSAEDSKWKQSSLSLSLSVVISRSHKLQKLHPFKGDCFQI